MTRKDKIQFIASANTFLLLPERKPTNPTQVKMVASMPWTKIKEQEDGSLYVQGVRDSYEVRAEMPPGTVAIGVTD